VDGGLVELSAGLLRLTGDGKAKGQELIAADARQWGTEQAQAAVEDFHGLDLRMKEAVTAWQLREVGGAQVLNDHSDADYDAKVLAQIAHLHNDAEAWLSSMRGPSQLGRYLERLIRSIKLVSEGDHRFVASPRVDSYHSIWFELHEELILLAGRTRDEEAAAGRA
jgi:pyruvate,orthophosphate dikinase